MLDASITGGALMNIVLLIIATVTATYLFYALICPERF
ncbi:potassium-transporting ATPase subunit F [Halomonas aquamarina]|uniref:Potassium-transporting ATPase subunit F n=1 Tax=Vreelandella aquamarina TaxID=77097 RepID=A0ACC5VYI6_9GAMM|nr:potassium-transporting ATPase subunit F [Halomonas aquamarina]